MEAFIKAENKHGLTPKPKSQVEVGMLQLAALNKIAVSLEHIVDALQAQVFTLVFPLLSAYASYAYRLTLGWAFAHCS